ncbi:hypothetical protein [Microcoleus sp. herbarium2]|uniref:hypothetical protein n=1 Tax=Microcoleus sp. herbarium2 TaxID=3055433 RepID=UPI002FD49B91
MAFATFNPSDSELLKKIVECMGDSQGMVRLIESKLSAQLANLQLLFCWKL